MKCAERIEESGKSLHFLLASEEGTMAAQFEHLHSWKLL